MKQIKPIIWGMAIIALGIIFGGNALGWFSLDIFFDGWWTLFIIIPSVVSLITDQDKIASLGFLAAGIILLLAAQNVFSYDVAWKVILAVFLIMIGLSIIIKSIFHSKNDQEVAKKIEDLKNDKVMDSQFAAFSGSDRVYKNETFTGSSLSAIFGGVSLDLRDAKFTSDTVIRAFALFGGIDIAVPPEATVKLRSGFIFGGISDDRKANNRKSNSRKPDDHESNNHKSTAKGKYIIYIDAAGAFGGVTISDKDKSNS